MFVSEESDVGSEQNPDVEIGSAFSSSRADPRSPSAVLHSLRDHAWCATGSDSAGRFCTAAPPERCDDVWVEKLNYELRTLVPHLSPEFECNAQDALLLLSAIRSGTIAAGRASWEDRLGAVKAEKHSLQQQLERKSSECENLKNTVAEMRQKLQSTEMQARSSVGVLSKRRDEVRRHLLLEESRTHKLTIRNGQLEMEVERLKDMLRTQMRK
ncbi:hypothetical protein ERJ75_000971000 [Trypanosoma vivax]|uniref:Uncharacterized protein n=1 Tax=Trypanosoma vivax (strain Y486) TaxID=1055687 RepID=G0U6B1_TRYVY|nr:hypothetical protein TRVL_05300 [Trypanosoma vivax]KAH8611648.1 hypothetical protein ERJ75_000971000 [Trypanosoma vivax]CCC51414.1 conserved hypothetical protein [Trypanosoma vivax Y486]